jgi:hypothetical protein
MNSADPLEEFLGRRLISWGPALPVAELRAEGKIS